MCVLLSCGGRVGFLFLLVRFFFCSVLRSVVRSLNGCSCLFGSMGDGMGSNGVMAGWVGLRSISSGR
jgi:hypothetical protein